MEVEMQRVENALKMKDEQFKRILGTTKAVFQQMLTVLQFAYSLAHEKGGHPGNLSTGDKLLITLQYWREYRTMEHIAVGYGVDKGTVCRSIQWVEDVLNASGILALPGEEVLGDETLSGEELVVDVTEHPIERPKNKQRDWYSGKKNGTRLNRKS
ncbi:hypothetical protein FACS189443_5080 [Planctomycetales bacterium]|nr:hypothetical protein FACS189443_5080 [Planctomycetales bacterium]